MQARDRTQEPDRAQARGPEQLHRQEGPRVQGRPPAERQPAAARRGSSDERVEVALRLRAQADAEVHVGSRDLGVAARPDRAEPAPSATASPFATATVPRWVSVTE